MELITLFWISTLTLWVFLGIIAIILTNKKLFLKRGYPEAYADFLQKDNLIRLISIAIAFPIIELIAAFMVKWLIGANSFDQQITWITLITLAILVPIIISDHIITKQKLQKLAKSTKPEIVIDFKFKTIKLVFNPTWEIVTGILFLVYGLLVLKPFWIAYIHLIIPWFLYLTARRQSYATKPMARDSYHWIFVFMMLNYALILYYQTRCFIECYTELQPLKIWIGYIITALLVLKFLVYALNYPRFKEQLVNN